MFEVPLSWIKDECQFSKELVEDNNNPKHMNALVKTIGIDNVLRFIDKQWLLEYNIDMSLKESEEVKVLEDM